MTRVNPRLDEDTHQKLQRLALACNKSKTGLAEQIISIALRTEDFVNYLQQINKADQFRVIPVREGKTVTYIDSN